MSDKADQPEDGPAAGPGGDLEELRESLELLNRIINWIGDAVFVKDEAHRYVLVNDAQCRVIGLRREEILGRTDDAFHPKAQVEVFARQDDLVLTTGKESLIDEEATDVHGTVHFYTVRKALLTGRSGRPLIAGVAHDISNRRRSEQALRQEKLFTDTIIGSLPGFFYILDCAGRLVRWNKAVEEFTGLPPARLHLSDASLLVHEEDRRLAAAQIRRILEEGYGQVEVRGIDRAGTVHHVLHTGRRMDIGGGVFLVGTGVDITKRKLAEQGLQSAKDYAENLVATASAMVVGLDLHGNIQVFNRAAEVITGYTRAELENRNWFEVIVPRDRYPQVWEEFGRLAAGGLSQEFENPILTRSGEERFIIWRNSLVLDRGAPAGTISFGVDVTEQRQLELRRSQAQKLESIGQLAAGIAHEINTPVQFIGDNLKFLEQALTQLQGLNADYRRVLQAAGALDPGIRARESEVDVGFLKEEIPRAIQESLSGVERVARIVRAMKDFSHPDAENKEDADLNRAIESTVTVARNEWKYVADLELDLDDSLTSVPCLAGRINQVILNLIVNAAHAIDEVSGARSGEKGTIRISTRRLDGWAEVRVADTGAGIPEAIRSRIFDPFFTTKPAGKGTGQGLAIAHHVVVKQHAGTITVESEPGRGATFIIRLPLAAGDSARRAA